jgi:hypothetical protein
MIISIIQITVARTCDFKKTIKCNSIVNDDFPRGLGMAVRCIKDI